MPDNQAGEGASTGIKVESRIGLVGECTFESSDGTDTSPPAANDLTLVDTAIVSGDGGLALDTLTTGYGINSAITNDLKTVEGTLEFSILRKSLDQDFYIYFSEAGGTGDELGITVRKDNVNANVSNNISFGITTSGTSRIVYYTQLDSMTTIDQYYKVAVTADGTEFKFYVDDILQTIITKAVDDPVYRGEWTGNASLSNIDSFTVGGINRTGVIVNNGEHVIGYVRLYDYIKTYP